MNRKHVAAMALGLGLTVGAVGRARSQEPAPAPPAQTAPAQTPAASTETPAASIETPATQETPAVAQQAPVAAKNPLPPAKKGKAVYTGPTTVVELPPTPMLDAEGKQRLDPEGQPMFNPPVKQQRDKKGHPLFDEKGAPVMQTASELGFDDKGKKLHVKKEKEPKTIAVSVSRGTLTVDGLIGKAGMNYEIKDLKYIYLYAPWIGTVVVSNVSFPGSKLQANAFDKNTLTVLVGDHNLQLYSDKMLLGKKPEPAFVMVDRDFKLPSQMPVVGYGATLKAPYSWPGAKENAPTKGYVQPPPIPTTLRPVIALSACPPGQMRAGTGVVLPGEVQKPDPCVPIVAGKPAVMASQPAKPVVPTAPAANAAGLEAAPAQTATPPPLDRW